jgi:hypothetical protein
VATTIRATSTIGQDLHGYPVTCDADYDNRGKKAGSVGMCFVISAISKVRDECEYSGAHTMPASVVQESSAK